MEGWCLEGDGTQRGIVSGRGVVTARIEPHITLEQRSMPMNSPRTLGGGSLVQLMSGYHKRHEHKEHILKHS